MNRTYRQPWRSEFIHGRISETEVTAPIGLARPVAAEESDFLAKHVADAVLAAACVNFPVGADRHVAPPRRTHHSRIVGNTIQEIAIRKGIDGGSVPVRIEGACFHVTARRFRVLYELSALFLSVGLWVKTPLLRSLEQFLEYTERRPRAGVRGRLHTEETPLAS
jgi:hypothetical protein